MLPCIYESVKKRVIKDLLQAEAISVTFDAWTAKNSTHSLLSFTAHFVQNSVAVTDKIVSSLFLSTSYIIVE
uniref:Uncharacterized protein n=1 Tax=Meloidogyne incognita TaxID=6306 RepID=A0A914LLQ5_MELIC